MDLEKAYKNIIVFHSKVSSMIGINGELRKGILCDICYKIYSPERFNNLVFYEFQKSII